MITEAYTPKPDVQHLDEVYDFKKFCMDDDGTSGRVLAPLNNISFNHVFLIKKCDESANQTLLCETILLEFTMGATRGV